MSILDYLGTFIAVFMATILAQVSLWIIERYKFKEHFNKTLDKIHGGLIKMPKLILDIDVASNQGYVVTWYKTKPNTLQALGGTKPEKETLVFPIADKLVAWLESKRGG